jgi:hypothetical protein
MSTKAIGGSHEGEGLPFGLERMSGDGYAEQEDFPTYRDDVYRKFGLRPSAFLRLTAGCHGEHQAPRPLRGVATQCCVMIVTCMN